LSSVLVDPNDGRHPHLGLEMANGLIPARVAVITLIG
jgi:hypothetical protein